MRVGFIFVGLGDASCVLYMVVVETTAAFLPILRSYVMKARRGEKEHFKVLHALRSSYF
ncbi:hypothetical protein M011DRAFT_130853 [Sporormia fimetaria CBS 119925]|uniref:Uncharacterized protein n=1 Tax=Sporormia fimetaria CBS 119925 TaxID=1340428 RepID=A0A6A6V6H1_9PLEO|nr:hypothetical protein M011DRAFT_130853 [Sporormia fimetaria CBS 119925]